jgi:hypothetical protein
VHVIARYTFLIRPERISEKSVPFIDPASKVNANTLYALNSGIVKISPRQSTEFPMTLYRGLHLKPLQQAEHRKGQKLSLFCTESAGDSIEHIHWTGRKSNGNFT